MSIYVNFDHLMDYKEEDIMAEYIERDALIERLGKNLAACNPGTFSELCFADAIETVKHFPAADVAPVVRCKDCKYGEFVPWCSKYSCRKVKGFLNFHDFYCKDGIRKENEK